MEFATGRPHRLDGVSRARQNSPWASSRTPMWPASHAQIMAMISRSAASSPDRASSTPCRACLSEAS